VAKILYLSQQKQIFTMKIATTKERILQLLENKKISRAKFFKETGIKRGFLDSDKLNQAVSDEHFAKIIAKYPDINIEWLLTGKGEMLRNVKTADVSSESTTIKENNVTTLISILNRTLAEKDKQIDRLLSIIETTNKQKK
jgi:hypothetical protein